MRLRVRLVRGRPDLAWEMSVFGFWFLYASGWLMRAAWRVFG